MYSPEMSASGGLNQKATTPLGSKLFDWGGGAVGSGVGGIRISIEQKRSLFLFGFNFFLWHFADACIGN